MSPWAKERKTVVVIPGGERWVTMPCDQLVHAPWFEIILNGLAPGPRRTRWPSLLTSGEIPECSRQVV